MMAGRTETFAVDVSRWVGRTAEVMDKAIGQSVQELAERIIVATPVDTGFARASWWASIDRAGAHPSPPAPGQQAEGGLAGLSAVQLVAAGYKPSKGIVFGLYNNAAYILRLEYGWSKQAPAGMVRVAAAQWESIVDGYVAKFGGGG